MKKLIITTILIGLTSACFPQKQVPISEMTQLNWEEDLTYLNKRIQKEFTSFDPTVKPQFEARIKKLIEESNSLSNNEVTFKIMQLMAGLGDGHTELQVFGHDLEFERLPISTYYFEDGLYLLGAHEFLTEHMGSEITHVGGLPASELLGKMEALIAHDNEFEILHSIPSYLLIPRALKFMGFTDNISNVTFTLKNSSGKSVDITLSALTIQEYLDGQWVNYRGINGISPPLSATPSEELHWYEYLVEEKTMYFWYGSVSDQKGKPKIKNVLKDLFREIDNVQPEKFVIDMRRNSGGNYHRSEPLLKAIKEREWLNQKGKIYAINGRRTFSAAMVTSVWLKQQTQTTLIGEPSRGNPNKTDNVEHFKLPNSQLRIEYTTRIKKHWPELGNADHVPLDIRIPVLFKDFANGNDPIMEYILKN